MKAGRSERVDRLLHRALPVVIGLVAIVIAFSAVAAVTPDGDEADGRRLDTATSITPSADRRGARDETARPVPARPTAVPPARVAVADATRVPRPPAPKPAPVTEVKVAAAPGPVLPAPSASDSIVGVGAKLLLGSLLLAGLLFLAARYAKRLPLARFLPSTEGPIKVIGRSHLGPKGSLALVQVGGTTLLVGITQASIQTLHSWDGVGAPATAGDRAMPKGAPATMASALAPGQLRGLETRLGIRG